MGHDNEQPQSEVCEQVMGIFQDHPKVALSMVRKRLFLSESKALRALRQLESAGLISCESKRSKVYCLKG